MVLTSPPVTPVIEGRHLQAACPGLRPGLGLKEGKGGRGSVIDCGQITAWL